MPLLALFDPLSARRAESERLTIPSNGSSLEDLEAILGLPSRDFAVRELGKEFRLKVGLEVSVFRGQIVLDPCKSGNCLGLRDISFQRLYE